MNTLLDKEKMFYESLASKTSDKDFIISFHDYFSFVIDEGAGMCTHLYKSLLERSEDIENLENIYTEITEGVTKMIIDIEELLKKINLENEESFKDNIRDLRGLLNNTNHVFGGEVIDNMYFEMFDIIRRLNERGFEKEISHFVAIDENSNVIIEDILVLQRRKEFLNAKKNFIKKDARTLGGIFIRLRNLYIDINEAEQYTPSKVTPENFFDKLKDQAKDKEYTALMNGSITTGRFFRKDMYAIDVERLHQSIVVANPKKDEKEKTAIFYLDSDNDICHYEKGKLVAKKRGTSEYKYIAMFKNIIRYMPAGKSEIIVSDLEKCIPQEERVGIEYRGNLMSKGSLDKFLNKNNLRNFHTKMGIEILNATDKYIYFNNTI